jgi:hypothetical protein
MSLSKQELKKYLLGIAQQENIKQEAILNQYPYSSIEDACEFLGLTQTELETKRLNKKIIGFTLPYNLIVYPTWQFIKINESENLSSFRSQRSTFVQSRYKIIDGLSECLETYGDVSLPNVTEAIVIDLYNKIDVSLFDDYTLREFGLGNRYSIVEALTKGFSKHAIKTCKYLKGQQK